MLDARRLAHGQAAGLAAWGLQPPLRVVALAQLPAAAALAPRLAAGWMALGLSCATVAGAPPLWDDAPAADVWLWRADPDVLARWWPRNTGAPLVPLLAQPPALVAAYRALKTLRLQGASPAVLALARAPGEAAALQAALVALGRTCAQHLGWRPAAWTLGYHHERHTQQEADADTTVLTRALEAAWLLDTDAPAEARRPSATC